MNKILAYLEKYTQDAILAQSTELFTKAADDSHAKQDALNAVVQTLGFLEHDLVRDDYVKNIAKQTKIPVKTFKTAIAKQMEASIAEKTKNNDNNSFSLPQGVDKDDFIKHGFYGLIDKGKTGYYFRKDSEGSTVQVSNFVLTPLFHKYDQEDNTRIIKIDNGMFAPEIVEMPSKALISVDQFRNFLFEKGPFFFDGTKLHLDKLNRKYLFEFPKAFELKTLGWQPEGFFAYFNYSFNGVLKEYNEVGIVEHDDKHYFSPASSDIYKDYRKEDDMYENDRFLHYSESDITFEKWCRLMADVYEDHAKAGIAYVFVSLFRDIVFKVDNNCPHLYSYGQSQSGKSKFAESISNLFFAEMPGFNLNSGTDFAFANRLSRFRNCPVFFNEFDDQVVKDDWFQSLKGAYDGEGRERGKGGSKKKTEIQKVNCSIMLVGQYLSTKDDNSVLSRSIMRVFYKKKNRSQKQSDQYAYLKLVEKQGLSSLLTGLLSSRKALEKEYYSLFSQDMKAVGDIIKKLGKGFNERVLRNYTALLTMYKFFGKIITLPWDAKSYTNWIVQEVIAMSAMISNNDVLTEFWTSLETMFGEGVLKNGIHFKIEYKTTVRLTDDRTDVKKHLGEEKALLYLRLKNVQQLYQKFQRSMNGQAIDLTSLSSYLHDREYYVGYVGAEHFQKRELDVNGGVQVSSVKTSAFVFDYAALDISIDREVSLEPLENNNNTPAGDGMESTNQGAMPF